MITLSRFGMTVTPGMSGALVKWKPEPEGRLDGGAVTGGAGWAGVLLLGGGVGCVVVAGVDGEVVVGGSAVAAAAGGDEDPLPPPQPTSSAMETALTTWRTLIEPGWALSIGR